MARTLLFFEIIVAIFACSFLSVIVYPLEDSLFCHFDNSVAAGFSGLGYMAMGGVLTLIGGSVLSIFIVRSSLQRQLSHPKTLLRVVLALLAFPAVWAIISVDNLYRYCPTFGRTLTPEQEDAMKHGSVQSPQIGLTIHSTGPARKAAQAG